MRRSCVSCPLAQNPLLLHLQKVGGQPDFVQSLVGCAIRVSGRASSEHLVLGTRTGCFCDWRRALKAHTPEPPDRTSWMSATSSSSHCSFRRAGSCCLSGVASRIMGLGFRVEGFLGLTAELGQNNVIAVHIHPRSLAQLVRARPPHPRPYAR